MKVGSFTQMFYKKVFNESETQLPLTLNVKLPKFYQLFISTFSFKNLVKLSLAAVYGNKSTTISL